MLILVQKWRKPSAVTRVEINLQKKGKKGNQAREQCCTFEFTIIWLY